MIKSKHLEKVVAIIMVATLCLMAVPQVIMAAKEPAYALNGTISSLNYIIENEIEWSSSDITGSIDVKLTGPSAGTVFTAYRLLDINNVGGMLQVSVPPDAQDFWKAYLNKSSDVTVNDIKLKLESEGGASAHSSEIVNAFVNKSFTKPTNVADGTASESKVTINAAFGFYIIMQTKAPANGYIASAPVLACLPFQKTGETTWLKSYTVIPKDDKIDITKKVKAPDDADYIKETITEIGDTLEYKIVADLAKYGSDITSGAITYQLVDPLPPGVKYVDSTAAVKFYQGSVVDTPTGTYEVVYDEGARTLTLDLGTGYAENLADYDTVELTYKATLESNAVVEGDGNPNTAKLTYTSANGETQFIESSAKVYTLELDITKVDKDHTTTRLPGAKFQVYKASADANNPENAVKFIDISSAGTKMYRVATDEEITDGGVTKYTELEVSDVGEMKIYGLNDATYYFKETVAPTGYNLPDELFEISPEPENSEKTVVVGEDTTYHDMEAKAESITNDSGINLPVTGGMGTILFTAIGLLLMAGAAYFLFGKKKDSH